MFEHAVSLWRKLVGSQPRKSGGVATDDRRVWVRYPADLRTTYQRAGQEPFDAEVRDISLGGMSLAVDVEFRPGELLSVELPGADGEATYTVLACVVYANAESDGRYVVGCTFARELSDRDLQPFGARRSRTSPADQRAWQRYACDVKAMYQLASGGEVDKRQAKVLNISPNGVGLLVDHTVETGTLLSVDLSSPAGKPGRTMLSCVVHVSQTQEGEWALGCNFISEMSEEDLGALL